MTEGIVNSRKRFWGRFTLVSFALFVIFSVFSYINTAAHPGLRPGRQIPDLPATTITGEDLSLVEAARGRKMVMIVSPTCDICATDMMTMVEEFESGSMEDFERPGEVLWLILRSDGMPRAVFMEAYRRGMELGIGMARIEAEAGRELGITRVPVMVALDQDGTIASISYPRETSPRQ